MQPQQHNPPYHQHNIGAAGNIPTTTAIQNAHNFMNAAAAFNLAYGQQRFPVAHQFYFQHPAIYPPNQMPPPLNQIQPQLNQIQPQQHHTSPNMQHSTPGRHVKNLRTVELPFYDLVKVILPMTQLPSYPVPTRPGEGRYACQFGVAAEDIAKLSYPENQKLPRYELQLRVFLLDTNEEQQDAFPPGSTVRLDDLVVNLPPVIPTNKPNAEQKRYPRPVNLTPYCRPAARGRERPHRLAFEWNGDKRAWAFTVLLVHRQNSDILLERMRNNPVATRPKEHTKETIIRRLNGADEDDVQMDSLKISLTDPLMRTRMKIPARAVDCTHLQTFDLNNYLMMNEKRPGWKCPVCDRNAIYSKLIIDEYFECVLKEVGESVEEVELLRDGTWRLVQANNVVSIDSDEDDGDAADEDGDIMVVKKPTKGEKKKAADPAPKIEGKDGVENAQNKDQAQSSSSSRQPPPSKDNDIDDIICLSSDSDDEDAQIISAIAASNIQGSREGSTSAIGTPNSNTSNNGTTNTSSATWRTPPMVSLNGHSTPAAPPELQTNGHQQIFHPIIDEAAKTQIAQHLAFFLQGIYAKNNPHSSNCSTTPNSNNDHPPLI